MFSMDDAIKVAFLTKSKLIYPCKAFVFAEIRLLVRFDVNADLMLATHGLSAAVSSLEDSFRASSRASLAF